MLEFFVKDKYGISNIAEIKDYSNYKPYNLRFILNNIFISNQHNIVFDIINLNETHRKYSREQFSDSYHYTSRTRNFNGIKNIIVIHQFYNPYYTKRVFTYNIDNKKNDTHINIKKYLNYLNKYYTFYFSRLNIYPQNYNSLKFVIELIFTSYDTCEKSIYKNTDIQYKNICRNTRSNLIEI